MALPARAVMAGAGLATANGAASVAARKTAVLVSRLTYMSDLHERFEARRLAAYSLRHPGTTLDDGMESRASVGSLQPSVAAQQRHEHRIGAVPVRPQL